MTPYFPVLAHMERYACLREKGRVEEIGTHEELMARNHIYRDVYDSQMSKEVGSHG